MRETALLALFKSDRFAYHQWLYTQVETLAFRVFGRQQTPLAKDCATTLTHHLVAEADLLKGFEEDSVEEDLASYVYREVRPQVEGRFLARCREDENFMVLRTQEIAKKEVYRLFRHRRPYPGSSDEDLIYEGIQYVMQRLSWGRRVVESFTGRDGMNFSSYLRTCVRHAAIDRVRTQVGRTTLWDEMSSLDDLSGDDDGSWEQWLIPSDREVTQTTALDALLETEDEGRLASVWGSLAQMAKEDGNPERARVVSAWLERGLDEEDLPSIQDLAQALDLPRGAVSSHLFRFRKMVGRKLPEGYAAVVAAAHPLPLPDE